jgi:hypothetical protein
VKLAIIAGLGATLAVPAYATLVDFEGPISYTTVTTQWAGLGVNFTGGGTILSYPDYNYLGYPPHSYDNVVYEAVDGIFEAIFDTPVSIATIWYTLGTGTLKMAGYDSADNFIVSATATLSNYGFNDQMGIGYGGGLKRIVFSGTPNFFTVDDLEFSTVPEPASLAVLGLGAMALLCRRRAR